MELSGAVTVYRNAEVYELLVAPLACSTPATVTFMPLVVKVAIWGVMDVRVGARTVMLVPLMMPVALIAGIE